MAGLAPILIAQLLIAQPVYAQSRTRDGAVLGGVGGAIIGGIIGKQNDETPEGALIGGAVGAVAGGLLGNARDQQVKRDQYYQQQQWNQYQYQNHHHHGHTTYNTYRTVPPRVTVVPAPGVTIADILSMTRNGVGESVIVNHIYTTGMQRRIDTNEIIMLHQQGVTENIINAMQQAPVRGTVYSGSSTIAGQGSTTIVTPPGGTVIVQEPSYARPTYYQGYPVRRGF
jgi:YMGG-like Gly-zipper